MAVKKRLAHLLVARFHGGGCCREAEGEFARRIQQRELPADISTVVFKTGTETVGVVDVLASRGLVASRSEARRMISQGAVRIDGERVTGSSADRDGAPRVVVRWGRVGFALVEFFFGGSQEKALTPRGLF